MKKFCLIGLTSTGERQEVEGFFKNRDAAYNYALFAFFQIVNIYEV